MLDWIETRLAALREHKVIDITEHLHKENLQDLQKPVNNLQYANAVKKLETSPLKQTTYEPKRKNK